MWGREDRADLGATEIRLFGHTTPEGLWVSGFRVQ